MALARELTLADRDDPTPHQALLTVYEGAGHWALASRSVDALLRLQPTNPEWKKRQKHILAQLR